MWPRADIPGTVFVDLTVLTRRSSSYTYRRTAVPGPGTDPRENGRATRGFPLSACKPRHAHRGEVALATPVPLAHPGEHLEVRGISRPRSASINRHNRRRSSPVRVAGRQSEESHVGPLILQERPRRTDREIRAEIRALEDERRALQLVRREESPRGPDFPDRNRDREEIIEVRRDRKGRQPAHKSYGSKQT